MKKLILCGVLISPWLYADNISLSLMGGFITSSLENEPLVEINNFVTNAYITNKNNHWGEFWGGSLAHSFEEIIPHVNFSLGVAGYAIQPGEVKGTVFPFINEGFFDSLNYKFQVKNNSLMIESGLSYGLGNWRPFIIAGIGKSWNRLENYNEVPSDPASSATALPSFRNNSHHAHAYELGLGCSYLFYEDNRHNIRYMTSAGYRFWNLGKGELESFAEQTSISRLHSNNIKTQGLAVSLDVSFY